MGALLLLTTSLFAQENVVEEVGDLLDRGKLKKANIVIEKYLAQYPDNVDVLMMKGNVVLSQYFKEIGSLSLVVNDDESIYEPDIGFIRESVQILPKEVAGKVVSYWKKCLEIDNTRGDIHKGLCYLYSMALMKDELIEHLHKMKVSLHTQRGLMYTMGDYARMFYERDEFDMCMEVYGEISQLYPEESGIYGDIGALYFMEGKLAEAQKYTHIALQKSNPDEMVYANVCLLETIHEEYDEGLEALKHLSELVGNHEWLLYKGLLLYYQGDGKWQEVLMDFLKKPRLYTHENLYHVADFLLSIDGGNNFRDYLRITELNLTVPYAFLIHRYAMNQFPDHFEPSFNYAELQTYYKNYDVAVHLFRKLEERDQSFKDTQLEEMTFYYAWALQNTGNIKMSTQRWEKLLTSDDFYKKSAAAYFYGKNIMAEGKDKEALRIFRLVAESANESKYATYCWNMVKTLEDR
jgi:tetratricopeptide (TPR) repeat protein